MSLLKSIQYIPNKGYKNKTKNIQELEKQIIELGKICEERKQKEKH